MQGAFWNFALASYRRPQVEDLCLALQQRYAININLLLLGQYAACEFGALLGPAEIAAAEHAISPWNDEVVKPLRELRGRMKSRAAQGVEQSVRAAALREQIKTAELDAEAIEVQMLEDWLAAALSRCAGGSRHSCALANAQAVLVHYRADLAAEAVQRLSDAMLGLSVADRGQAAPQPAG